MKSVVFDVGEQMILSGWIRADDLIDIDVTGTTGIGSLLSFEDGPNSFTADIGSGFVTYNDNARINVNTTGSIRIATGIDSQGVGSQVNMSSETGLAVLGNRWNQAVAVPVELVEPVTHHAPRYPVHAGRPWPPGRRRFPG